MCSKAQRCMGGCITRLELELQDLPSTALMRTGTDEWVHTPRRRANSSIRRASVLGKGDKMASCKVLLGRRRTAAWRMYTTCRNGTGQHNKLRASCEHNTSGAGVSFERAEVIVHDRNFARPMLFPPGRMPALRI